MKGRVYDPLTAQFFSPDPFVTYPNDWLNYNRYAYGLNNPFKYTDPSGNNPLFIIAAAAILLFTDPGYEIQKIFSPVAVHINLGIGSDQLLFGWEVSVGVPKLSPISYRYFYGETYYDKYYDNSFRGKQTIEGSEIALNGYMVGIPGSISYYKNKFSGTDIDQETNMIKIGGPFVNLKFEDNNIPLPFGLFPGMVAPGGDDYRSSALELNVGPFNAGFKIMDGKDTNIDPIPSADGYKYKKETNVHRLGLAYFGFGPLKFGWNSEKIRAGIQNEWHKTIGANLWDVLSIQYQDSFYWYFGSTGGSTLW